MFFIKNIFVLAFSLIAISCFSQIKITEILIKNTNICPSPDVGTFSSWIELYNSSNKTVNLSNYYITDNNLKPNKWKIPDGLTIKSGEYILIWMDGINKKPKSVYIQDPGAYKSHQKKITEYHAGFKLNAKDNVIAIFNSSLQLVDSIAIPIQFSDISYGINSRGEHVYFENPTPEFKNDSLEINKIAFCSKPTFSKKEGFYDKSIDVELKTKNNKEIIRYTTDGSIPNSQSKIYKTPLKITKTTILKARCFAHNTFPGKTITKSFFIEEMFSLPVISISTDSVNLWSSTEGIYVEGKNFSRKGKHWVARNTANFNQAWEKPIHFEYFDEKGTKIFASNAGLKIHGRWISCLPQKPMGIYLKSKYDSEEFNYQLFPEKSINAYNDFVLRNFGDGWKNFLIRDAVCSRIITNQMDIDYQAYEPVIVFLNGKYWGIHSMREKLNSQYLVAHHKIDAKNIDFLEDDSKAKIVINGDKTEYQKLYNKLNLKDINTDKRFKEIEQLIDIDEYINYQIVRTFFAYFTLDHNNKYWKPKTDDARWRWMAFDLENSKAFLSDGCNHNTIKETLGADWTRHVFTKLMQNDKFKNEFIQRYAGFLNTTFSSERMVDIIEETANEIRSEVPRHIKKWRDKCSVMYPNQCSVNSVESWEMYIDTMKQWASCRPDFLRQNIENLYKTSGSSQLTVYTEKGCVKLSNISIKESGKTWTYFNNIPIKVEAIPEIGYKFVKWIGIKDTLAQTYLTLNNDDTIRAVFEPTNQSILAQSIDKNTTLSLKNSPYFATGDVIINAKVKIEDGVEIYMPDKANIIVNGKLIINGSEENPVRILSNTDENARIEFHNDYDKSEWGAICFEESKGKSKLSNVILENASLNSSSPQYKAAISAYKSNVYLSNVTENDAVQPFYSEYGKIHISNCTFSSESVCDLINIKYASRAKVENCNLKGNNSFDTDAIDYDGISKGSIEKNNIFGFFGFNSDGIDIGEEAHNIIIKNNFINNCNDKGISVGQASSAVIENNIIVNCGNGVGIKDKDSYAYIENTTFYNNDIDVACFEKNIGKGGGRAKVRNTIFSNTHNLPVFVDSLSEIEIMNSISNTDSLDGDNNIYGRPIFENASKFDFDVKNDSPCHKKGNELNEEIGANLETASEYTVVINEICYNLSKKENTNDWIEIYNHGNDTLDISGWIFKDSNDKNTFELPSNTFINPKGYIVLCKNSESFHKKYPKVNNYIGDFNFDLSNSDEMLRLFNHEMLPVSSFEYKDSTPWPEEADGKGKTLELKNPLNDCSKARNWKVSEKKGGTPGKENS